MSLRRPRWRYPASRPSFYGLSSVDAWWNVYCIGQHSSLSHKQHPDSHTNFLGCNSSNKISRKKPCTTSTCVYHHSSACKNGASTPSSTQSHTMYIYIYVYQGDSAQHLDPIHRNKAISKLQVLPMRRNSWRQQIWRNSRFSDEFFYPPKR